MKLFIGLMIGLGCGLSFGSWHEKRSIVDLTEYTVSKIHEHEAYDSMKFKELGDYCVEKIQTLSRAKP